MSMLIKLSLIEPVKKEVYIRAHLVMAVERSHDNPLITLVQTSIMTNKGPVVFQCMDSPESVSQAVNHALMSIPDKTAN